MDNINVYLAARNIDGTLHLLVIAILDEYLNVAMILHD